MNTNIHKFKVLIVDDDQNYRETHQMLLTALGYNVKAAKSGMEALSILENEHFPLVVSDILMDQLNGIELLQKLKYLYSDTIEVILVTGEGSVHAAVNAMKLGAFGYFIKSHNPEEFIAEIKKAQKVIGLENISRLNKNANEEKYIQETNNPRMKEVYDLALQVSKSNSNVLITGESGVGKEIIANYIYQKSNRSKMPFIPINCQYFSSGLIESELFGHEKGAFTGAFEKRVGRLEEANGGVLFLDEIGDMDLSTQIKFLRVLENKTFERIGSNQSISTDFRLISATNKNIQDEILANRFREDFLYRINTIEIHIPPLRERKEDLNDLIDFFINMYSKETTKNIIGIDDTTRLFLNNYDFPGNIRELRNIIERLVVLSKNGILDGKNILFGDDTKNHQSLNDNINLPSYKNAKITFEKAYFTKALYLTDNNITKAASISGISRRQFFNKITDLKIHI